MNRGWILLYAVVVLVVMATLGSVLFEAAPIRVVFFASAAALATAAVAVIVERKLTRPLREVTAAAHRIINGQYGHKVYALGQGELGTLARAFNDMSERLEGQFSQVDSDRQQLRTILGGMIEGVVAIDRDQRLQFANDRAAEMLEFHPTTAIGHRFWEIVRQKAILALVEKSLVDEKPRRDEFDWRGNTKSLALYVSPLSKGSGAILVLHDISELRRLERLRHEFVANVSHELKTPLAVIKANVETLIGGAVNDLENRIEFLEQINEQAERLHNLIIDLLSLARIESGNQQLEIERVSIGDVISECVERQQPRLDGKAQSVTVIPPDEPSAAEIWTDHEALGQILDNLIDNAVKYTPEGSEIRIHWYGCGDQVCLEVRDNGPGIPDVDLPRIFERFYRVDKARSRELGGTGLGLAIVKNLVQILKGTVKVQSTFGQGAVFTVCLPVHTPDFIVSSHVLHTDCLSPQGRDAPAFAKHGKATMSQLFAEIITHRTKSGWSAPDLKLTHPKFEVTDVSFWYGSKQALFDISLRIPEKSVTALIGPSGCGKSTFLRLLNRMNDLIEGTRRTGLILMDGRNIYGRNSNLIDLRRRVGMVFQKSNPFPKSVYENVVYGPRVAGIRNRATLDALAERCLRQVTLWDEVKDRLDDSALNLSGGQAQRLCIARSLATDPQVLLMDEPTSALDPRATAAIEDLIFELKRDYTIVIVTHNMQQAARVSDSTAFFYEGKLIESGTTERLFTRPLVKQTEDYVTGRFG